MFGVHSRNTYLNNNLSTMFPNHILNNMPWIGVYHSEMAWYNGRDNFFHITSGAINTWKGVNQLIELFLINLIFFFLNIYLNLTNHRYFIIKDPLFFTIHNKIVFFCKILSLNDLTPCPISRQGTYCLQWQWVNARANLWWRHEPFSQRNQHRAKACAGKAGVAKRSWWCLGIIPSNRCCQFSMISQILEEIHL